MKQDVTMVDKTGRATLILWGNDVGVMEVIKCLLAIQISASVVGLKDLETHYACVNCNKPAVTPTDEHTGVCDNCSIMQKLTSKQTTKLIVTARGTRITLKAFDDAIREIAQCKPDATKVSPQELLFAPAFNCSYNKFHTITKVSRQ